jgi:hypothetical protein
MSVSASIASAYFSIGNASFCARTHAIDAPRVCCASHTCAIVGNSKSPSTTPRRRPEKESAVATAAIAADALGMIAISSTLAPIRSAAAARSRSTSPTQRSQGDPSSCQDAVKAPSAASTSVERAPCEQLLT